MNSDERGFLTGGIPIDSGRTDYALDVLRSIKSDTAALLAGGKANVKIQREVLQVQRKNTASNSVSAISRARKSIDVINRDHVDNTRIVKEVVNAAVAETASSSAVRQVIKRETKVALDDAKKKPPRRGRNGRFLKRDANGNEIEEDDTSGGKSRLMGGMKDLFEKLKDSLSKSKDDAMEGVDKVDPAVEAANEIKQIGKNIGGLAKMVLTPFSIIAMPIKSMFKKKDAAEKALPVHKKILKKLDEILKKREGKGMGGMMLGGIGSVLMSVLTSIFSPVGAVLKTVFGGGARILFQVLGRVFLPITGVLAAGFAGWSIGTWLYEKYGKNIQDALETISTGASDAWKFVSDSWDGAISKVTDIFSAMGETWDNVVNYLGEKVGYAKDVVKETGSNIFDKVASGLGLSGSSASNKQVLINEMAKSGMGKQEQAMFMANMDVESGGFRRMDENMNYSSVGRIKEVFGKNAALQKLDDAGIAKLVNNPQGLANVVYGNRMGNGADGYTYRGRGFTQLSGKDNYRMAGEALGLDLVNNPDLLLNPEIAAKVSLWKWQQSGASKQAKLGNITGTRKAIQGGSQGLSDVKSAYEKYSGMDIISNAQKVAYNAESAKSPILSGATDIAVSRLTLGANKLSNPVSAALAIEKLRAPNPKTLPNLVAIGNGNKERTIIQTPAITQNIGDRGIAQLVTGGIGGGGNGI